MRFVFHGREIDAPWPFGINIGRQFDFKLPRLALLDMKMAYRCQCDSDNHGTFQSGNGISMLRSHQRKRKPRKPGIDSGIVQATA